ncbi:siderophore biosynthesis protein [Planomonospora sp. ID91781]|uniref:IucA/IucC family protein n=1 Tax=Planomonospora sp. ID91781 TaxID=2738135 RepID=UPI0018C372E2|nr:IucA/IucC family protein [Planomonospora sp. ID91781]MBG0825577.1 siderophore biosynthesis protein [Planomonospora sp. ID91781]
MIAERAVAGREPYLAARVLDALLREDYGGLAGRVARRKDGVVLHLPGPGGRPVRLVPGSPFQDFTVAPAEHLSLAEVLGALRAVAHPADAAGVEAFAQECREALRALDLHDAHRRDVLARLRRGPAGTACYEALAAFLDHPVYPTARCRAGLSDGDLTAYAPEFAPSFELRWAAVPRERVTGTSPGAPPMAPDFTRVGLAGELADTHVLFPVHPLALPAVRAIPWAVPAPEPYLTVRPTLSMRTVEVDARTHLKLPLPTSTLGLRNRRSIKPGTLADGARAELLLRRIAGPRILLADEQVHAHTGHEYLAWLVRRLPPGEIVPVAALLAPLPEGGTVAEELAARRHGGVGGAGGVEALLTEYLRLLFASGVRLLVRYGVALEAHQQNLALVLDGDGPPRLLVKDNDGLLASPGRLRAAGTAVPDFADGRMLTDDPHALADVFVTITLHLAAAAPAFGALPPARASRLLRDTLAEALEPYGDDPAARLLRARSLDAARLVGKSMVTAGTLVDKARTGARDVNKFYGTSGPNYLRHPPAAVRPVITQGTP